MDTSRKLKLFGYPTGDEALDSPLALSEVTLAADADTLRMLAAFMNHVASLIDEHGVKFGHEHYSDFSEGRLEGGIDIIVTR